MSEWLMNELHRKLQLTNGESYLLDYQFFLVLPVLASNVFAIQGKDLKNNNWIKTEILIL